MSDFRLLTSGSPYATISVLIDPHFQQVNHFQSAPM
jgi:hypothetical protein